MIQRFKDETGLSLSAGLNNERSVSFEPNDKGLEVYASGIEDVVRITLDGSHEEALLLYLLERRRLTSKEKCLEQMGCAVSMSWSSEYSNFEMIFEAEPEHEDWILLDVSLLLDGDDGTASGAVCNK